MIREADNLETLLSDGMMIKNWNELCDLMGWKRTKGGQNSRISQEKDLNTLCKWHKQGHKIIIDEVYENPILRENNRFKFNDKYKQFNIPKEFEESMIIYEIVIGNEIYIGSTMCPKERFYHHIKNDNNNHKTTCDMLKRGASFNLIQVFEDEELMRMCENELIKLYYDSEYYDCKNKRLPKDFNKNKKSKKIKKTLVDITVEIEDLEDVINLLQKKEINYKLKKVG